MFRWLAILWLAAGGLPPGAWAADALVALPRLEARVTDLTATLTREQRAQLDAELAGIEREKGTQIAILLIPSVRPETIEQYGIRLAEAWRVGRRGVDDGAILIVAKNDRKLRLEVGYGLEGALPDAVAKRIVSEIVTPRFKEGDFFGGLAAATAALGKILAGEELPPPAATAAPASGEDDLFFLVFIVVVMAGWARKLLGLLGSLLAAGLAGWLALGVFGSWLVAGLAALAAFALSFAPVGGGRGWHAGGGGGGGFSGGGGFTGGGGGFGGGGASGSW
jgi:uncharacterized protein